MRTLLQPTSTKRILFFILFDILLSTISLFVAYLLRFNFEIPTEFLNPFLLVLILLTSFKLLGFFIFRTYFIVWRFFGFLEAKNIFKVHLIAYALFTLIFFSFPDAFNPFPRSVIIIDFMLSLLLIGGLRISKRIMVEQSQREAVKPTLIIGVNNKTTTIIKNARSGDIDYYPSAIIALLDENKSAVSTYLNNVKIFDETQIERLVDTHNIEAAIITTPLASPALKALFERLNAAGISEIKQVKLLGSQHEKLMDLSIEDLLARKPKDLDSDVIKNFVHNRSVLITGAGGSIGSEIAQQCHAFGASELILVDNSEFNLYSIGEKLPNATLSLNSVVDAKSMSQLFEAHKVDIVIHAAAYKHVPICEANIDMAIRNNVLGSKNIIDLCIQNAIAKLVIISTDKAVRPTNVMGATKRISELYAQNVDSKATEIVAVRFGNVLGSSGSVIPKFKAQIEANQNLTVTHKEMTRYFMMIPEACQLVLQAAAIAKGNELFILDMGKPVKIVDLAKQMIRLYGKEGEIDIEFCGLRPGEKMYEELLLSEAEQKTKYESIFITNPTTYEIERLNQDIKELFESDDKLTLLKRIVPEFNHKS